MNAATTLPSPDSNEPSSTVIDAVVGRVPSTEPNSVRENTSSATRSRRKNRGIFVWLIGLLFFLVFALIAAVIYATAAWVSGLEMNAVTWQARRFHFWRDPFTDTQLSTLQHDTRGQFTLDPAIAAFIAGGPSVPARPRWDLVNINRGLRSGTGEASLLVEYLQTENTAGENLWVKWTNANPQLAPILWAAVRDAVHLARYDGLPEIFETARLHEEAAAFKAAIAKVMLALAIDEAEKRSAANDTLEARRAAEMGLSYGESPRLQALVSNDPHVNVDPHVDVDP